MNINATKCIYKKKKKNHFIGGQTVHPPPSPFSSLFVIKFVLSLFSLSLSLLSYCSPSFHNVPKSTLLFASILSTLSYCPSLYVVVDHHSNSKRVFNTPYASASAFKINPYPLYFPTTTCFPLSVVDPQSASSAPHMRLVLYVSPSSLREASFPFILHSLLTLSHSK